VQNLGQKTREMLQLVPDTTVNTVEHCSDHDGTWGVKKEYFDMSMKIGKPVFKAMANSDPIASRIALLPAAIFCKAWAQQRKSSTP
jgi:hypothetical protein